MKTVKYYNLPLKSLKDKQQHEKISTVLFYQVCADTVKAKQTSRIWAQAMFFFVHQLIFDLLTLKMVSESHVTWATSVPILVFLGLSVLDLGPMYATDRQTSDIIIALCPVYKGWGHNKQAQRRVSRRQAPIVLDTVVKVRGLGGSAPPLLPFEPLQ